MTIEDMKQGVSKIRNSVIARIFRELGLIEQWGSGVRRIFREAREQDLPEPQIVEIGMRIRFVVPLTKQITVQAKTRPVKAQVKAQVEAQVELDILAVCAEHPLSSSEIATALGHKKLSGNLRKALPRLKESGLLAYTIPETPKSRLQKYRLTSKGQAVIDAQRTGDTSGDEEKEFKHGIPLSHESIEH